jgi:hypothetical protein
VSSQSFKDDNILGAVELCRVREASPIRTVEFVSLSPVKAVKKLAPVKGLIHRGVLGSNSISPSLPVLSSFPSSKVDIVESLVRSIVSTSSHALGAVELGKSLPRMLEVVLPFIPLSPSLHWGILGG